MYKRELKNEIETLSQSNHLYLGHVVSYKELMVLIDNLDDTPTTEQAWKKIAEKYDKSIANVEADFEDWINSGNPKMKEKPEIPKFVADWIEEKRPYYSLMTMVGNYLNGFGMPERVEEWITDNKEDYLKALVIGYAIEKEPAWVVRINEKLYFCRFTDKYFEKDSDAPTYIESGNPSLIKKFTNKDKAEAVAILVDGEVEEWSE